MSRFDPIITANSVSIGGEPTDGNSHNYLDEIVGLGTSPVRLNTQNLSRASGDFDLSSYNTGRVVTIDGFVVGATEAEANENFQAIKSAYGQLGIDEDAAEAVTITGLDFYGNITIFAKIAGQIERAVPFEWDGRRIDFLIPLYCPDFRIYGSEQSESTGPASVSGGLSYPVTYPKIYGASGAGGTLMATNGGDVLTYPTLEISKNQAGTATDPIIEQVTTGESIALTANGGASISNGQTLIIKTHPAERSIAFSTGASRYGKLSDTSTFFGLPSGSNSIRLRASGNLDGLTLTVKWRNARR